MTNTSENKQNNSVGCCGGHEGHGCACSHHGENSSSTASEVKTKTAATKVEKPEKATEHVCACGGNCGCH